MTPVKLQTPTPRAMADEHHHHFLIVTYPAQGHITPARHLARRLATTCPGARVTICVPLSAFRKMFPSTTTTTTTTTVTMTGDDCVDVDAVEVHDGDEEKVTFLAYSDGYDGGFDAAVDSYAVYMDSARLAGSRSLAAVLRRLRSAGRPVTCAVYTLLLPWVSRVAREHGVDATAVFWIQPATALAAYYHYFRGHRDAVVEAVAAAGDGEDGGVVRLPGLPPLRVRDLPSFLAVTSDDHPFAFVLPEFQELVDALDRDNDDGGSSTPTTYVLANTCDAMEHEALASLRPHVRVFAVGPVLSFMHEHDDGSRPSLPPPRDVFEHDDESGYMGWLDTKPANSVVYVSFGSSSVVSRKQAAEIAGAMALLKRPFLWVLRKDNRRNDDDDAAAITLIEKAAASAENGMVVEWCDQARVLRHGSVGCFVTHCGWNSTLEAVACGVPVVAVPQYSDQGTAAWLVADRMRAGVRAAALADGGGVVEAEELARCVEAAEAREWMGTVRDAVADGGSSHRELTEFLSVIDPGRGRGD